MVHAGGTRPGRRSVRLAVFMSRYGDVFQSAADEREPGTRACEVGWTSVLPGLRPPLDPVPPGFRPRYLIRIGPHLARDYDPAVPPRPKRSRPATRARILASATTRGSIQS